jgi:aminoglycoside phosphotransferase
MLNYISGLLFGNPNPPSMALDPPDLYPWLEGTRIYSSFGRMVVKCEMDQGAVVRKISFKHTNLKSEACMGNHARTTARMMVPAFRNWKIENGHEILTTAYDPGQPVGKVWNQMTWKNQASIKEELKEQIRLMRQCTSEKLGCVNMDGKFDPKIPVPDPYNPSFPLLRTRPCSDEQTFEANKLKMVKRRESPDWAATVQERMQEKLKELSIDRPTRFVLTHGDLTSGNIMVQNIYQNDPKNPKPHYVISGIIDWQFSAFFPEYMEYAIAKFRPGNDVWGNNFIPRLLEEMGYGCSNARLDLERLARGRLI